MPIKCCGGNRRGTTTTTTTTRPWTPKAAQAVAIISIICSILLLLCAIFTDRLDATPFRLSSVLFAIISIISAVMVFMSVKKMRADGLIPLMWCLAAVIFWAVLMAIMSFYSIFDETSYMSRIFRGVPFTYYRDDVVHPSVVVVRDRADLRTGVDRSEWLTILPIVMFIISLVVALLNMFLLSLLWKSYQHIKRHDVTYVRDGGVVYNDGVVVGGPTSVRVTEQRTVYKP